MFSVEGPETGGGGNISRRRAKPEMFSQPATIDTLFEPHMAIFKTIVMLRMRFFFLPFSTDNFSIFSRLWAKRKERTTHLKKDKTLYH